MRKFLLPLVLVCLISLFCVGAFAYDAECMASGHVDDDGDSICDRCYYAVSHDVPGYSGYDFSFDDGYCNICFYYDSDYDLMYQISLRLTDGGFMPLFSAYQSNDLEAASALSDQYYFYLFDGDGVFWFDVFSLSTGMSFMECFNPSFYSDSFSNAQRADMQSDLSFSLDDASALGFPASHSREDVDSAISAYQAAHSSSTLSSILSAITDTLSSAVSWLASVAQTAASTPIILVGIVLAFLPIGVGLFQRLVHI